MTTAEFWNIVNSQKVWKEIYEANMETKKNLYREKCKQYQEIQRRILGKRIRNALSHF